MFLILGKSQKYFSLRQKELGNLNGHIEEVYSGLNVVKSYNGQKIVDEKFDNLNQKDVDLIFSHINSTPRNSLGFKTPFELFKTAFGIEVLRILNINEINKDDVHLKPELIK